MADRRLKDFDPATDYLKTASPSEISATSKTLSNEDGDESFRRSAFQDHALNYETPEFWKNFIENRSKVRRLERDMLQKRKQSFDDEAMDTFGVKRTTPRNAPNKRRFGYVWA